MNLPEKLNNDPIPADAPYPRPNKMVVNGKKINELIDYVEILEKRIERLESMTRMIGAHT